MRVSSEEFLSYLQESLKSHQNSGSVYITQKKVSTKNNDDSVAESGILIRLKDKKLKDIKRSTILQAKDIESFFTRYMEICKTEISNLKKRDRSKKKKKTSKK